MILNWQGYWFDLKAGGEVEVTRGDLSVSFLTGCVVTRSDLMAWAHGFMSGKSQGWGELL